PAAAARRGRALGGGRPRTGARARAGGARPLAARSRPLRGAPAAGVALSLPAVAATLLVAAQELLAHRDRRRHRDSECRTRGDLLARRHPLVLVHLCHCYLLLLGAQLAPLASLNDSMK